LSKAIAPVLPPGSFPDQVLRGISQLLFLSNPVSGAAILGNLSWISPTTAAALLAGSSLSIFWARLLPGIPQDTIDSGLIAFNGCLVGMALPVFTVQDKFLPVTMVLGTLGSVALFSYGSRLTDPFGVPILSLPFVICVVTAMCFVEPAFPIVAPPLPTSITFPGVEEFVTRVASATPLTFTQLFFNQNWIGSFGMWTVAALTDYRTAISGAGGAAIGIAGGLLMGFDISSGLWGFNSALSAMCVYPTFGKTFPLAMLAATISTLTYPLALNFFGSFGFPALSFTFCVGTVIALKLSDLFAKN